MKTARKAIHLLRQFTRAEPELGVSELARRLGMDRAGVHRLLRALLEERFVEQDPGTRLYRLGLGVLDVAAVRISQHGLLTIAPPHLERLRDAVGETVALLVADGQEAVCLAVVESRQAVRVGYDIGERMPLHASAGGQALLAHFAEADRRAVYAAGLARYTPRTLTDPEALEAHLARIRQDGAGSAEDSYYEGIVSAAAPVMDPKQRLAGAVSIAAPMPRRDAKDLPALAAAARRTADAIAADWAGLASGAQRLATKPGP
ncbi:IclR family transcriptional regulator [Roseomonas hellenica]|uniref:IclR family transcriptional regulator n=1 Tax=Plastoroseomonas hellenica TaxID=2687306 RepID=A0ABS5F7G1_9PROT|nr:IclR family transcriptional regulator [Plastoroseomonas hellenica]MBR0668503.1 IclR family transcriptional regulator [Plastoroseomonas hellenica]